jgi:hypothetical protein
VKIELATFILMALNNTATTYGWGEQSCNGACREGYSTTASGEKLLSTVPSAAIPIPAFMFFKPFWLSVKTLKGKCTKIRINDKTSPRLIGKRGFDLSPRALFQLTNIRSKNWTGKLYPCRI